MLKSGRVRTIQVPLRKICSALPALAMVSGGIVLSASAAPKGDLHSVPASSNSPAVVVPDIALTLRPPGQILADATPVGPGGVLGAKLPPTGVLAPVVFAPVAAPAPLVSMIPAGTAAGSSSPVTLDSTGIPVRALEGYRKAADLTNTADPGCHIDWALLGAIGRVESNHARFGGNQLDNAGVARPGIIGIALDGSNGTARITDTDNGVLDRDTTYDRAVGPMQFIPSTWSFAGVDANGDGAKDPQNMADAAAATAVYLCSGPGDLRNPADLHSAILRYNNSDSYVQLVTSIANAYRHGVRALPASDLTPAPTPASPSIQAPPTSSTPAAKASTPTPGKPATAQPGAVPAAKPVTPGTGVVPLPGTPAGAPAGAKPAPAPAAKTTTNTPTPAKPTNAQPAPGSTPATTVAVAHGPVPATSPATTVPPAAVPPTKLPVPAKPPATTVPPATAPAPAKPPATTVPPAAAPPSEVPAPAKPPAATVPSATVPPAQAPTTTPPVATVALATVAPATVAPATVAPATVAPTTAAPAA